MKTFKDIVSEVAQPLAGDEKRFKEKHKVNTIGDPQNNGDKLYKGSEIEKDKTKKASYEDGEDSKVYEEVEMDEAKGEDAYYARYGAGGKKKSPEEVAADKGNKTFIAKSNRDGDVVGKLKQTHSKLAKEEVKLDEISSELAKKYKEGISKELSDKEKMKKETPRKSMNRLIGAARAERRINKEETNLDEKNLTPAEMKKREEVARAIERENPNMPMAKKMAIATATAKKVAESYDPEGEMAKTELRAIAHKALQLHSMMEDDDQLEAWLQSKITKAKYMIDSVYDYILYNSNDEEESEDDYTSELPYPNRPVMSPSIYGEEVEELDELDRNQGSILNRYIRKTTGNPKRASGRNLALMKKHGDNNYGLPEPKVKAVQREAADLDTANVDKEVSHDCAKHVVHEQWGVGECVTGMHTIIDTSEGQGIVSHYDVMFEHGIEQNVPAKDLEVTLSETHMHKKMKEEIHPNQKVLDKNKNKKIDAQDFEFLRKEKKQ